MDVPPGVSAPPPPPPRPSIPSLLNDRLYGRTHANQFWSEIIALKRQLTLSVSTHVASAHHLSVDSLHVDRTEGRFLLAGSRDATVSIYDLSKWGTDHHLQGKPISSKRSRSSTVYTPIAHSLPGRRTPIVDAQWYPSDTGAFVTASAHGLLSVWDTDAMTSVAEYQPLSSCYCMHLSPLLGRSQNIAAFGAKTCSNDVGVKLVDLQSGATSHSLVGHQGGITAVQWSPVSDVVLASGSTDGTIRLWDIRKAGSRSCLCVLDRDRVPDSRPCKPHYAHLNHLVPRESKSKLSKLSPNNFRRNESNAVVSHGGAVTALSFCEDGLSMVSTGTDGKLQVWDLRDNGHLAPISFRYRGQQAPVSRMNQRIPLHVKHYGVETIAWVAYGSRILGYSLESGGLPTQVLEGHMLMVTALDSIDPSLQLVSGANDGMILTWEAKKSVVAKTRQDDGRSTRRKRPRETTPQGDRDSW